jgi:hypothetical protein
MESITQLARGPSGLVIRYLQKAQNNRASSDDTFSKLRCKHEMGSEVKER